ncbi:hypothetical protein [Halobacterium bonnevillei]|uniref:Uncharacterized protein n=1 Tax=Halobacterium bonnevillei TaxID=2692200 RepID=A0A6B0SQG1_9EURY|nr:hypothetical protein [Halobacterium bonnevillei]MXR21773.1 hypothetical protein [Halobacterium bonnevillei]
MTDSLTALSQRTEAFWIGLTLILLGALTPETVSPGGIGLSRALIVLGGGLLLVRVLVAVGRFLKTTAEAGLAGYREGKNNG